MTDDPWADFDLVDVGTVFDSPTETEAEAAARLADDVEIIAELQAADFRGPVFEAFRDRMWLYAMPVLQDVLRDTGRLARLSLEKGRPLRLSDHTREALHTSRETRDEIAVDVISKSFEFFVKILKKNEWRSSGRASLTTYFIGACILGCGSVLRRYEIEHRLKLSYFEFPDDAMAGTVPDPADRAAVMDTLRKILRGAKPDVRHICGLILEGYSSAEIGQQLGISERAVEGRLYRLRRNVHRQVRRGQIAPRARRAVRSAMTVSPHHSTPQPAEPNDAE